jgi:quercetin dioxygenase-like cupin family protein
MSAFDRLHDIAPQQIWPGLIGRSLQGDSATLAAIELDPGIDVPEHSHVNEQIGILTGGSITFPAHVPHSVRSGPQGATLIELFAPRRDDWGGHERLAPSSPKGF